MNTAKRMCAALAAMLLVLSVILTGCTGEDKAPSPDLPEVPPLRYVYDEANVLSTAAEHEIVSQNNALFALSGAEIAVVCLRTTGNIDIDDYAYTLFNKWGIGSAERNNGILILLSIDEDDYWTLQGMGLEDIMPSGILKLMVDEHLEPYFARQEYEDGVLSLFAALRAHLEDAYGIDLNGWDGAPGQYTEGNTDTLPADGYDDTSSVDTMTVIVVIIIIVLIIAVIANNNSGGSSGGGGHYRHRAPRVRITSIPIIRPGFRPGGHVGGSHVRRPSGGFSGGSRGGSFGGSRGSFGGGRSRGGGAGRR